MTTLLSFQNKAETLSQLRHCVKKAVVLPLYFFSVKEWEENRNEVLRKLVENAFPFPCIVRSSALSEDGEDFSCAGQYCSIANVNNFKEVEEAIDTVIHSYGKGRDASHLVFIQTMLTEISLSGVVFTSDPNTGAPYIVINYDEQSKRTDTVTGGNGKHLKTLYHHQHSPYPISSPFEPILELCCELMMLFDHPHLDIEFAFDQQGALYLFQVRRLKIDYPVDRKQHATVLHTVESKIKQHQYCHPDLCGKKLILGVMPDWNPAEIIGTRPKPLALSLYKELITNATWAYQRDIYGYRKLRGFPLLVDFYGMPYIDVRVSFNSFIPKKVDNSLAEKLVNFYLQRLMDQPQMHDKVEFNIVYSCYTFDLAERMRQELPLTISQTEQRQICESLRELTNVLLSTPNNFWQRDLEKIAILERRYAKTLSLQTDEITTIYWLLEDCRRYGTLPFAGLARAAFIATQLLDSLISVGILTENEKDDFMKSLYTVNSSLSEDFLAMNKRAFLEKYGHLRPGTYDITSLRYDEAYDNYFTLTPKQDTPRSKEKTSFSLSLKQMRAVDKLLKEHQLQCDVVHFFHFLKTVMEGREWAKFVFTKSISTALSLLIRFGKQHGISSEEMAFIDIKTILSLYSSTTEIKPLLSDSIEQGQRRYQIAQSLCLPQLITDDRDIWSFFLFPHQPNFITTNSVKASVYHGSLSAQSHLSGKIICIPHADPGFDWIFTHNIAGFITLYGGKNSHMAIRAAEHHLPAVIGLGETLYHRYACANQLTIDCLNERIEVIS